MSEEYDEEEEDYYPKTLRDAVEQFLVGDLTDSDEEVIRQCPPHRLDWLHSNFERSIMSSTGLNHGNTTLIAACCPDNPEATAHDASRVIMEAIRVLFQTGEFPPKSK